MHTKTEVRTPAKASRLCRVSKVNKYVHKILQPPILSALNVFPKNFRQFSMQLDAIELQ